MNLLERREVRCVRQSPTRVDAQLSRNLRMLGPILLGMVLLPTLLAIVLAYLQVVRLLRARLRGGAAAAHNSGTNGTPPCASETMHDPPNTTLAGLPTGARLPERAASLPGHVRSLRPSGENGSRQSSVKCLLAHE